MRAAYVARTRSARILRKNSTPAERKLWRYLRSRSLAGFKFVRQQPIGPYIVDFLCREKRLVIEVDGSGHGIGKRDARRELWLTSHRYCVLRFWNNEVIGNIEGVWEIIFAAALATNPPHPDQLPRGNTKIQEAASTDLTSPRVRGEVDAPLARSRASTTRYGASDEGASKLPEPIGNAPSPQPSPRKRGEGVAKPPF